MDLYKEPKKQLRILLISYVGLLVLGSLTYFFQQYLLTSEEQRILKTIQEISQYDMDKFILKALLIINGLFLIMAIVSIIGLYLFWNKARYVYLVVIIVSLILPILHSPKWEIELVCFLQLEILLAMIEGAILYLIFFGQVAPLFRE
jgi:hypothetical protein